MGASSGIFKGNVRIIEIRKPHKRRKLVYNAAMPLPASLIASIVSTILEMAAQNAAIEAQNQRNYDVFVVNRTLPPEAKVGVMQPLAGDGKIIIDDKTLPISPATQFRSRQNLIVMPATIQEKQDIVYLNDFQGIVHRVWMISPAELEAIKATPKN